MAVQVARSGRLGDSLAAAPIAEAAIDGGLEIGLLPYFGGWVFEIGDGLPAAAAAELGYTTRVARQDGEDLALTMDYSESRVNVAVEADVVVEILFIG